jgi:L-fuculose-phosphate aldolase
LAIKEDLIKCGHDLLTRGLIWGTSGNISARVDDDTFLISSAGSDVGELTEWELVLCHLDEETYEGEKAPSIERPLHDGVYLKNKAARAVIHAQPFYSSLVACSKILIHSDLMPETMFYLGKVERVPYRHPGSRKLADAVAERSTGSRVLLLDNHGVVCWGSSIRDALTKVETLEFLCRVLVTAGSSNLNLNYLGEEMVQDFIEHMQKLRRQ